MTLEVLKIKLYKHGRIEMIKEGLVFTVLMTGNGLSKFNTYNEILAAIVEYTKSSYPVIECMKNENNFFLIVLKKNQKEVAA